MPFQGMVDPWLTDGMAFSPLPLRRTLVCWRKENPRIPPALS
jgi:hypothetical protein